MAKTSVFSFRITPGLKEALREAASTQNRSSSNLVEFLIIDYCKKLKINVRRPGKSLAGRRKK